MKDKQKVIVVGCGFAGLQFTRHIDTRLFDVLLIDRLNHHQFQPLFYQVATSQIEPSSISFPVRSVFQKNQSIQIRLAEVTRIRTTEKKINTSIGEFSYDYLVLAQGCTTNFFGNDQLAGHCFTLKSTHEAIRIRNHILRNFESMVSASEEERECLRTLVIVGGGPTGVELAGSFAEMKKHILPRDYPGIDFSKFRILLIEGGAHTLNNMSDLARRCSRRYLEKLGVEIITNTRVTDYSGCMLSLSSGVQLKAHTVIWAAGVIPNILPGFPDDVLKNGRILTDRYNRVQGFDSIFALGDAALMITPRYTQGHPQVANVAINQAKNLARNLKKSQLGNTLTKFEYKDFGSMATIGTNKAVVDFPFISFKGLFAWLIWMFLHLMLILSVKNKLIIFINWAWAYITKDTSLRLILDTRQEACKNPLSQTEHYH